MKIKELAEYTGLNTETIRKYRDRGLLQPQCNSENGYYEYSEADAMNLLYIRKLRGANLSLDTIEKTYTSKNVEALLAGYRETLDALEEELRQLRRKEMMLRLTYRHYEREAKCGGKIQLIESFGDKYDCYFQWNTEPDPIQRIWIHNVDLLTLVVCIEQRYLEESELPERIPIRLGAGTYIDVLKEEKIPIPEQAKVFPKGQYVSFFLRIEDLDSIPAEDLHPVREYLKENNLRPASDTTAYLFRVDNNEEKMTFVFCVRFLVRSDRT